MMKQKDVILTVLVFFFVLICSCQPSEKYQNAITFSLEDFRKQERLEGKSLQLEDLEMPTMVRIKDSMLFVINSRGYRFLNVYNLNNKEKVQEVVDVGSGPEELIMCNSMQIVNDKVYLSDIQQNKFVIHDIPTLMTEDKPKADTSFNVRNVIMQNPLWLSENRFVANDLRGENQVLTFFDRDGGIEDIKTPFPFYKDEPEDPFLQKRMFESRLTVNPSYEKIYATYISTDLIDIYDVKGNLERRLHGPAQTFPLMKIVNTPMGRTVSPEKDNQMAYLSPIATDDKLWVLYYGKSREPNKPFLADQLLVFSYDGDPMVQYSLDTPIFNFCVDETKRRIYGITSHPEFDILYFDY